MQSAVVAGLEIVTADGAVAYPANTALNLLPSCATPLSGTAIVQPRCYLTPQVLAFASGGGTANTYTSSHINALPSFNVRFGLDDKDYLRFAYSRAMSRPDIGLPGVPNEPGAELLT